MVVSLARASILAIIAALNVLLLAPAAHGAIHYIRDGGTASTSGTGACTDTGWGTAQACDQLPQTLVRGDTYYVACGTYPSRNFNTPTSGTILITIKKATVADHGTSSGWNDAFACQAVFTGGVDFGTSYWVFDGQTGGGPGSWTSNYGFRMNGTAPGSGVPFGGASGVHDIVARHVEIEGHGPDDPSGNGQDGMNFDTGPGPLTFSYFWIRNTGRCPIFSRSHNATFEYFYTGIFESGNGPGDEHAETAAVWIDFAFTPVQNFVFRWSFVTDAGGVFGNTTGGLMLESDNAQIYGNVFVVKDGGSFTRFGNGLVGGWTRSRITNQKIYNNTFIGPADRVFGLWDQPPDPPFPPAKSADVRNNLFKNIKVGNDAQGYNAAGGATITHTHNHYDAISDGPISEATQSSGAVSFVNAAALDYSPTANTSPGVNLGAPYNVDMLGRTRTTWTRGAIEVAGEPTPPHPCNPPRDSANCPPNFGQRPRRGLGR